jgi:Protein of unknown function (DUF2794)
VELENSVDGRSGAGEAQLLRFPDKAPQRVSFTRPELMAILDLYGRYVAAGEWRDYAMEFGSEQAVFAIFRRASEQPLYRITKTPALARKQGAFAVTAQGGLVLKRGHELQQVLRVLIKKPKLADT